MIGGKETVARGGPRASRNASGATALANDAEDIDLNLYLETAQRAFFPHSRWMPKKLLVKALQGDLTYIDRVWLKCAQIQAVIGLVEAILGLVAAGTIVFTL